MSSTRRLAAILAADVVGYARLMQADETGTLAILKSRRQEILGPLVTKRQGRVFKVTGDGALMEFASAVNAVQCAIDLQHSFADANADLAQDRRIVLRIGVHVGDVVVEGNDLYGDGVNIAARLEGLAEPGSILISEDAYRQVRNKIENAVEDLGPQALKNIAEPVRAYRLAGTPAVPAPSPRENGDIPSVAVLPFTNMSDDPTQSYFSDGITEDIITELSRWPLLHVLSRHATFQYRAGGLDLKQIGRQLGARFVVEGSVRRIGDRIRVTAQLIDAHSGAHVWAERYDRDSAEIFALQDEVVRIIAGTLVGRLHAAQVESSKRKPPASLAAYECVLRGHSLPWSDPEADAEATRLYRRAIELDPGYGRAHSLLALMTLKDWFYAGDDSNELIDRALALAETGVRLTEDDSYCHFMLGHVHLFRRSFDLAEQFHRRAVELNPNHSEHLSDLGFLMVYLGRSEEAEKLFALAKTIDPYFDPTWYWTQLGLMYFCQRRYRDAIVAFDRSRGKNAGNYSYLAACHACANDMALARDCMEKALRLKPNLTLRLWAGKEPFKNQADLDHLLGALRLAGMPE